MARIFVSYSGRNEADKDFAARLLARVKEQGLDPWIFEDRGSEVPLGASIQDYCRKKIRKADLFVAVVSESSLQSAATRDEVAFALAELDEGEILPLVTVTALSGWPEPYCRLSPRKHLPAGRLDDEAIEIFIEDLCQAAGATYAPPGDPVRRLPLIRRLTAEVRRARPTRSEYAAGNFTRVRARAQEVAQAYAEGRVAHAYSLLDTLEADLRKWYEGAHFYYPRLILGVLLLEGGTDRQSEALKARNNFESMLAEPALAGAIDENLHAALAVAKFMLNDIAGATHQYILAAEIVRSRGEVDGDILHNLLMCRLVAGPGSDLPATDVQSWVPQPDSRTVTSDPFLYERLDVLTAACLAQEGDLSSLRALLATANPERQLHADILLRLAQDLASNPNIAADVHNRNFVIELHEQILAGLQGASRSVCRLSAATLFYLAGEYLRALAQLRAAQDDARPHPKFLVEEFWCLMQLDQIGEATEVANRAATMRLDEALVGDPPALREFQYFRGFAAWLTQQRDLAERDFRDSGYGAAMAYETIAERHIPRFDRPEPSQFRRVLRRFSLP